MIWTWALTKIFTPLHWKIASWLIDWCSRTFCWCTDCTWVDILSGCPWAAPEAGPAALAQFLVTSPYYHQHHTSWGKPTPPSEVAGVVWSRGYFSGAVTLGRLRLQPVVHKTSKNEKKRKLSLNVRSSYVMLSIIYKSAPEHKFSSISSHSMWYFKKWKCRRVGNYIGTPINI